METKLSILLRHVSLKEYEKAISLAAKFKRLGKEKDAIILAHGCITRPDFFKQIGYDIDDAIQRGINALINKYVGDCDAI